LNIAVDSDRQKVQGEKDYAKHSHPDAGIQSRKPVAISLAPDSSKKNSDPDQYCITIPLAVRFVPMRKTYLKK
jgi:hypothetical protein